MTDAHNDNQGRVGMASTNASRAVFGLAPLPDDNRQDEPEEGRPVPSPYTAGGLLLACCWVLFALLAVSVIAAVNH